MDPLSLLRKAGLEPLGPVTPLHGGDISRVYRVGPYVVKTADQAPPGLFRAEARGLKALGERGVRVPGVYWWGEEGIVLEYLPPGAEDWASLARTLAFLHQRREGAYGAEAGFLGTFPLPAREGGEWTEFFFLRCVEPLLRATWGRLGGLGPRVLAMMRLFGGFPRVFWQAYGEVYPIPEEVERALPRYQVYYLLAHVHFFGEGYLGALWKAISAS
jgi:phosphatidylserine decarboxylase